ncbi:MAG: hypothetical protein ACLQLO_12945 [Mycobacterium sp.]
MPSIELRKQTKKGSVLVATPKVTDITKVGRTLTVDTGVSDIGEEVSSELLTFTVVWRAKENKADLEAQYPILTQLAGKQWKVDGADGSTLDLVVAKV